MTQQFSFPKTRAKMHRRKPCLAYAALGVGAWVRELGIGDLKFGIDCAIASRGIQRHAYEGIIVVCQDYSNET